MKKPRPMIVTWLDTCSDYASHMSPMDKVPSEGVVLHTIGFLTKETSECITISAEHDDDDGNTYYRHHHTIPKACVKKKQVLR